MARPKRKREKAPVIVPFDRLPDDSYIRQRQLVPNILPFSDSTLWRKIHAGQFPAPVKLSERVTAWKVSDIREWLKARQG